MIALDVFIGLNIVRALSIVGLLLVFSSSIVVVSRLHAALQPWIVYLTSLVLS